MTAALSRWCLLPTLLMGLLPAACGPEPGPDAGPSADASVLVLPSLDAGILPRFVAQSHSGDLYVVADNRVFVSVQASEPLQEVEWASAAESGATIEALSATGDVGLLLAVAGGSA